MGLGGSEALIAVVIVSLLVFAGARKARTEFRRGLDGPTATAPLDGPKAAASLLVTCPDCSRQISARAETCPQCGAPLQLKADIAGARCPLCGNRDSSKSKAGVGCATMLFVSAFGFAAIALLFTGALWFVAIPCGLVAIVIWNLAPSRWECRRCRHVWRG